jgi:hypothetical protein
MAKYKLTVVHELEDNEGVQSESELEKYVQDVCSTSIGQWDRVSAALTVNKEGFFKAQLASADALHDKKHGWPWHCSLDSLPTEEDKNILVCYWDGSQWRDFNLYEFDSLRQFFHNEYGRLWPCRDLYWRTVAEPEPPKPRQHDSDS